MKKLGILFNFCNKFYFQLIIWESKESEFRAFSLRQHEGWELLHKQSGPLPWKAPGPLVVSGKETETW